MLLLAAGMAVWVLAMRPGERGLVTPDLPGTSGGMQPAPDFEIVLYQGEANLGASTVRLSQLWQRGRPVVLNFWAGLCPPCRVEMPDFERVYAGAKGRFTLIGVDIGPFVALGSREEGRALLQELRVTFPAGTTLQADTVAAYKILGMPTTVFITADGKIFKKYAGLLTFELMQGFVADLIRASGGR